MAPPTRRALLKSSLIAVACIAYFTGAVLASALIADWLIIPILTGPGILGLIVLAVWQSAKEMS